MTDESQPAATTAEVAEWMLEYVIAGLEERAYVSQWSVQKAMRERWGDEWIVKNSNGNWAIAPKVLTAWRKLPGWSETFEWDRSTQDWRRRKGVHPKAPDRK